MNAKECIESIMHPFLLELSRLAQLKKDQPDVKIIQPKQFKKCKENKILKFIESKKNIIEYKPIENEKYLGIINGNLILDLKNKIVICKIENGIKKKLNKSDFEFCKTNNFFYTL